MSTQQSVEVARKYCIASFIAPFASQGSQKTGEMLGSKQKGEIKPWKEANQQALIGLGFWFFFPSGVKGKK